MKEELIEYAKYTLVYKLQEKPNKSFIFSDRILAICAPVMLLMISVPLLMTKFFLWVLMLAGWILMLLYRKKENDMYMKAILVDGMFSIYAAIFSSVLLVGYGNVETVYLVLGAVFCLFLYEIIVLFRIKRKKYSRFNQNTSSQKNKGITKPLTLGLSSGFAGVVLSKFTSHLIPFSVGQIIFISIIGLLWLCGSVLIQKYLILKLLNN